MPLGLRPTKIDAKIIYPLKANVSRSDASGLASNKLIDPKTMTKNSCPRGIISSKSDVNLTDFTRTYVKRSDLLGFLGLMSPRPILTVLTAKG